MLPKLDQVLLSGWPMFLAYVVLLCWIVAFSLHVVRPAGRDATIRFLWALCLLTLGAALLHGSFHEMRTHRDFMTTHGAVDPIIYATDVYLNRAGVSLLSVCAMVQAVLTCWTSFLVNPGGERGAAADGKRD